MYNQDYDEGFPATVTEREAPSGTPNTAANMAAFSIREILQPYLKNEQVFKCPSASKWAAPVAGAWWNRIKGRCLSAALGLPGSESIRANRKAHTGLECRLLRRPLKVAPAGADLEILQR